METIIGLGQAGCNIADQFAKYEEYEIYKIDVGLDAYEQTPYGDFPKDGIYSLAAQDGPEEYEKTCPNMKNFFKDVKGQILFVLGGSGDITGASLRILEHLKGREVSVLYVRPDTDLLPEKKRMQERVTFNVLQEYARSAVFDRMFLVDNQTLEHHIGDVPLIGYYDKLNEMIVSTMHMINVYDHIDSETDTFSNPYETARISTIGIFDIDNNEDKTFFSGKVVVITGTLSESRDVWESRLLSAGAKVTGSVSKNTDFLLAGENPGSKLGKAGSLGVSILDETLALQELMPKDEGEKE